MFQVLQRIIALQNPFSQSMAFLSIGLIGFDF